MDKKRILLPKIPNYQLVKFANIKKQAKWKNAWQWLLGGSIGLTAAGGASLGINQFLANRELDTLRSMYKNTFGTNDFTYMDRPMSRSDQLRILADKDRFERFRNALTERAYNLGRRGIAPGLYASPESVTTQYSHWHNFFRDNFGSGTPYNVPLYTQQSQFYNKLDAFTRDFAALKDKKIRETMGITPEQYKLMEQNLVNLLEEIQRAYNRGRFDNEGTVFD